MDLKDTIAKWHAAMCLVEEDDDVERAVSLLLCIKQPSAKIFHNIGCIRMSQSQYPDAIQYLSSSLERDKYLALSYFLRGVCYHKSHRYDRAELDFLTAQSMAPPDGIDYRQLGANFILTPGHLGDCLKIARETYTGKTTGGQLPAFDNRACLFWPPKKMVDNLTKQDFLGKAKVISSTAEYDIIYATDKTAKPSSIPRKNVSSSTSPAALPRQSRVIVTPGGAEIVVPPHPRRPPPALPTTSGDNVQWSASPRSRLRREKSKSAENILDGSWDDESSLSSSHSGSRLNLKSDPASRLHTVLPSFSKPKPGHTQALPIKRSNLSSSPSAQGQSNPALEKMGGSPSQNTPPPKPQAPPGVRGPYFQPGNIARSYHPSSNSSAQGPSTNLTQGNASPHSTQSTPKVPGFKLPTFQLKKNSSTVEESLGRKTVKELAGLLSAPVCAPKPAVSAQTDSKPMKPARPPPPRIRKL